GAERSGHHHSAGHARTRYRRVPQADRRSKGRADPARPRGGASARCCEGSRRTRGQRSGGSGMKASNLVRVASQSIFKNKMRALLTMLGIIIGVGAVIVMVAVGLGARSQIRDSI